MPDDTAERVCRVIAETQRLPPVPSSRRTPFRSCRSTRSTAFRSCSRSRKSSTSTSLTMPPRISSRFRKPLTASPNSWAKTLPKPPELSSQRATRHSHAEKNSKRGWRPGRDWNPHVPEGQRILGPLSVLVTNCVINYLDFNNVKLCNRMCKFRSRKTLATPAPYPPCKRSCARIAQNVAIVSEPLSGLLPARYRRTPHPSCPGRLSRLPPPQTAPSRRDPAGACPKIYVF